jgi:hypothetical protein
MTITTKNVATITVIRPMNIITIEFVNVFIDALNFIILK